MVFRLVTQDDPLASSTLSSTTEMPSKEQLRKESKRKLMNNFVYFGLIIAGLRFASYVFNDNTPIIKIK